MKSIQKQLAVINLKERIVANETLRKRLANMLGQSKGWRELSDELQVPYQIVQKLKEMPVCELCYEHRDFNALRAELYSDEKEKMIRHPQQQLSVMIISPASLVEIVARTSKVISVAYIRKNEVVTDLMNRQCSTLQIIHDTNTPICLYGQVEEFICANQRITECFFLSGTSLRSIDVSNNPIKRLKFHQPMLVLKHLYLINNGLSQDDIGRLLPQLCIVEPTTLFEDESELLTDCNISGNLRWEAKQKKWIIKNV